MQNGNILLINPWIYDFAAYDMWTEPLGLLYIAGLLRENGYRINLINCLDRHHPDLLKLQNKLFLDIYPSDLPWEPDDPNKMDWPYNSFFLIPAHTFMKIDSIEPQLKMQLAMESNIEELLKEDPNAVEYMSIGERLVLTASTKELQAFVLKHVDDERLFADGITLIPQKTRNP